MRRGALVGLLFVCLVASACGEVPGNPVAPSSGPAAIATTRVTLVSGIELPIGGGTASIIVSTAPAARVRVQLVASGGALDVAEVTTDETGHASATWSGTETATITGAVGEIAGAVVITVRLPVVVPPSVPPVHTPPPPPSAPTPPEPQGIVVTVVPQKPSVAAGVAQIYTMTALYLHPGETVTSVSWEFEDGVTATTTGAERAYAYPTHGLKTIAVSIVTNERTANGSGRVVVTSLLR